MMLCGKIPREKASYFGMQHLADESRRQKRLSLLAALGLGASDEILDQQAQLCEEFEHAINAAMRSMNLTIPHVENFEKMVHSSITSCAHGWPSIRKQDVCLELSNKYGEPSEVAERAIDLALRLWLMLDCSEDASTGYPRVWSLSEQIGHFLEGRFDTTEAADNAEPITRFPRKFRAVNLQEVGNITVQWTSFLDDHLRFDEDTREVKIFNNKAWLVTMLEKPRTEADLPPGPSDVVEKSEAQNENVAVSSPKESGLPKELLRETLKTLDVLFPPWHPPTMHFLKSRGQNFHLLEPPRDIPKLREFKFWRYRLLDLIMEYESPPLDWKHIWRDRRNPTAFWTFWIGIAIFALTLIFGIVASVLAGIQIDLAEASLKQGGSQ